MNIADLRDTSTFRTAPDGSLVSGRIPGREIKGLDVVREWHLRAWLTPPDALEWGANNTFDLRSISNAAVNERLLEVIRSKLVTAACNEQNTLGYITACAVQIVANGKVISVFGLPRVVGSTSYRLAVGIVDGKVLIQS